MKSPYRNDKKGMSVNMKGILLVFVGLVCLFFFLLIIKDNNSTSNETTPIVSEKNQNQPKLEEGLEAQLNKASPPRNHVEKACNATVIIEAPFGNGTGFFIGDNCHIGSAVEVKNSIIMSESKIPHHNYVGDSVIGEGCNLGAGTKIANLRLDKKEITAMGINTGRHKLGAILGDGVQTGINACIDVGSLLGNGTYIGAGALASGVIAPNSRIYG